MQTVEWKYTSKLKTGNEIDVLEIKYHFKLPDDLKECIKKNNAGMPYPSKFDTVTSKNRVFGGLLSFNEEDDDIVIEDDVDDLADEAETWTETGSATIEPKSAARIFGRIHK